MRKPFVWTNLIVIALALQLASCSRKKAKLPEKEDPDLIDDDDESSFDGTIGDRGRSFDDLGAGFEDSSFEDPAEDEELQADDLSPTASASPLPTTNPRPTVSPKPSSSPIVRPSTTPSPSPTPSKTPKPSISPTPPPNGTTKGPGVSFRLVGTPNAQFLDRVVMKIINPTGVVSDPSPNYQIKYVQEQNENLNEQFEYKPWARVRFFLGAKKCEAVAEDITAQEQIVPAECR